MQSERVPVVFYDRGGRRQVVGEAVVDMKIYPDLPPGKYEINLNDAGLSLIKDNNGSFSQMAFPENRH